MNKDKYDATNSFKGYDTQYWIFISKFLDQQDVKYIGWENIEDISIQFNNDNKYLYQIKHHCKNSTTKENITKDSGIYKMYERYINKNSDYENVKKIYYSIYDENNITKQSKKFNNIKTDISGTIKIFNNIFNKENDLSLNDLSLNILTNKFINLLKIEYVNNFNIINIFNDINNKINKKYKLNNSNIENNILLSIIYKKLLLKIFNNNYSSYNKINIIELNEEIKMSLNDLLNNNNILKLLKNLLNKNSDNNIVNFLNESKIFNNFKINNYENIKILTELYKTFYGKEIIDIKNMIIDNILNLLYNKFKSNDKKINNYLLSLLTRLYNNKKVDLNRLKIIYCYNNNLKYKYNDKYYTINFINSNFIFNSKGKNKYEISLEGFMIFKKIKNYKPKCLKNITINV
jgi:hypothetical protein